MPKTTRLNLLLRRTKHVLGAAMVLGTFAPPLLGEAASAAATTAVHPNYPGGVSCYGDYCSGQDPMATGCARDAETFASVNVTGGRLDLRWSPTCKTEWARWVQWPIGFSSVLPYEIEAVQDTGYMQTLSYNVNGPKVGTTWTPMIYSPVHKVKAVALLECGSDSIVGFIVDCATNGEVETPYV